MRTDLNGIDIKRLEQCLTPDLKEGTQGKNGVEYLGRVFSNLAKTINSKFHRLELLVSTSKWVTNKDVKNEKDHRASQTSNKAMMETEDLTKKYLSKEIDLIRGKCAQICKDVENPKVNLGELDKMRNALKDMEVVCKRMMSFNVKGAEDLEDQIGRLEKNVAAITQANSFATKAAQANIRPMGKKVFEEAAQKAGVNLQKTYAGKTAMPPKPDAPKTAVVKQPQEQAHVVKPTPPQFPKAHVEVGKDEGEWFVKTSKGNIPEAELKAKKAAKLETKAAQKNVKADTTTGQAEVRPRSPMGKEKIEHGHYQGIVQKADEKRNSGAGILSQLTEFRKAQGEELINSLGQTWGARSTDNKRLTELLGKGDNVAKKDLLEAYNLIEKGINQMYTGAVDSNDSNDYPEVSEEVVNELLHMKEMIDRLK